MLSETLTDVIVRYGILSDWQSNNPQVCAGEFAWPTDFPMTIYMGTGPLLFNGLSQGLVGPTSDALGIHYGGGIDGSLSLSSGTLTLDNNKYYQDSTHTGTGTVSVSGWIFSVNGTLNLNNAPANAIQGNGGNGNNSGTTAGGNSFSSGQTKSVSVGGPGTNNAPAGGANGVNGGNGLTSTAQNRSNGGSGGIGGNGGNAAGGANTGGTGGTGGVCTNPTIFCRFDRCLMRGNQNVQGGGGGAGGGSGAGGGGTQGRGAGGPGNGGDVVAIYARIISRGASTAAGAISAKGGNGGNGGGSAAGSCGGGGGASGAGGGFVYVCYGALSGTVVTNLLQAPGGTGGNGSAGAGTGTSGTGGGGGSGGRIETYCVTTRIASAPVVGAAGSANSGATGGAGGSCNKTL